MEKIFVGAYAASPCHSEWKPELEREYLEGLAEIPEIGGLEIPFFGGDVHRHDPSFFLEHLNPRWDYVLTGIPGVMETLQTSPHFGLASRSEAGRQAALDFCERGLLAVRRINERLGRAAVRGFEIHSAPQLGKAGAASSAEILRDSISEIAAWDWGGASLLLEHCDRYVAGQTPAKGFLSLEDEIRAIREATLGPTKVTVLINWGRSAIEARDAATPLAHVQAAREAGLLGGLIFSGCTREDALYGNFADSHGPFASEAYPSSLMTRERVRECAHAAGWVNLGVKGFKIQALPKTLGVRERIDFVRDSVKFLGGAL